MKRTFHPPLGVQRKEQDENETDDEKWRHYLAEFQLTVGSDKARRYVFKIGGRFFLKCNGCEYLHMPIRTASPTDEMVGAAMRRPSGAFRGSLKHCRASSQLAPSKTTDDTDDGELHGLVAGMAFTYPARVFSHGVRSNLLMPVIRGRSQRRPRIMVPRYFASHSGEHPYHVLEIIRHMKNRDGVPWVERVFDPPCCAFCAAPGGRPRVFALPGVFGRIPHSAECGGYNTRPTRGTPSCSQPSYLCEMVSFLARPSTLDGLARKVTWEAWALSARAPYQKRTAAASDPGCGGCVDLLRCFRGFRRGGRCDGGGGREASRSHR
jgi:hypothetical protein